MKGILTLLFFISLISFSCSDSSTDPAAEKNNGTIYFSLDKSLMPSDVTTIKVVLSREGYENIEATINTSGSIIENTFSNTPAGSWKLLLKALNSKNEELYSEQTEIPVIKDNIINASASFSIITSNALKITFKLNWESTSFSGWQDYSSNPILTFSDSTFNNLGIQQPKVIYENGIYKMWYMGLANSGKGVVCYAESKDGFTWNKPVPNPVMTTGSSDSWDAATSIPGAIIKDGDTYKLYYVGWIDQKLNWSIGLATSKDGKTWVKYPSPIMMGTSDWESKIVPTSVIMQNGQYYLYYYGLGVSDAKIGLAISSDGINFTKYAENPILQKTDNWEGAGVYHPSVIKDGEVFKMIYSGRNADAFGAAISIDGKKWIKSSTNPFFKGINTYNNWGKGSVAYSSLLKIEDQYRIYYSGYESGSKYNIGVAVKK
jgi:predicted GH43/DUF377 family glycosyl hydrolase